MEIRLHGRGGQGGVTCAKIVAAAYARLGKSVQTFGDYAGERSGAPVRAYARVSDTPIEVRNKVYEPDHVVVLDPFLLGKDALAGLAPGGTILLNTPKPLAKFDGELEPYRLAVVDATAIARKHGIGTRTVVIVNTTIAGAFARAHAIPWEVVEATYQKLGFASNLAAAREAWESVEVREPVEIPSTPPARTGHAASETPAAVEPLTDHVASAATGIRTGSWSTQRPAHVEHLAPCSAWCPAGNDVVGFVRAMATDGEATAAQILARTTPFAGVCGRVCPAPCMEGCNRGEYDGSVNIRGLERWISDRAPAAEIAPKRAATPKLVAIVGGGPAGLSAARVIASEGHRIVIYDGEAQLGGVLVTGIPAYRLPREVVKREVDSVLALGVDVRCGELLSKQRVAALAREVDALVLATGLQRQRGLDVPGAKLAGIEQGLAFLRQVNLGGGARLAGSVVVLGGGNTAIDCARSALRSGAERVTIAYRRSRVEMPAIREEIEEALQEGVELLELRAPVGFRGNGHVQALELAEVELGEPDATGRRQPVVTTRVAARPCDHVLLALGQSADLSLLPASWEIRDGRVLDRGRETNVFAAGDLATGDGTVTHAIGSGRRAAGLVLRAFGQDAPLFERPDRASAVPITDIRVDHFSRTKPARDRVQLGELRKRSFGEVNQGLADALEAHRCFSCGHCTRCDTCLVYCPEGIIRRDAASYEVDYTFCKGCGICVKECPRGAMEMSAS